MVFDAEQKVVQKMCTSVVLLRLRRVHTTHNLLGCLQIYNTYTISVIISYFIQTFCMPSVSVIFESKLQTYIQHISNPAANEKNNIIAHLGMWVQKQFHTFHHVNQTFEQCVCKVRLLVLNKYKVLWCILETQPILVNILNITQAKPSIKTGIFLLYITINKMKTQFQGTILFINQSCSPHVIFVLW